MGGLEGGETRFESRGFSSLQKKFPAYKQKKILRVNPRNTHQRFVSVGQITAGGKAHPFPKGVSVFVAGKNNERGFADSGAFQAVQSRLNQLPGDSLSAEIGMNCRVINVAAPSVVSGKD